MSRPEYAVQWSCRHVSRISPYGIQCVSYNGEYSITEEILWKRKLKKIYRTLCVSTHLLIYYSLTVSNKRFISSILRSKWAPRVSPFGIGGSSSDVGRTSLSDCCRSWPIMLVAYTEKTHIYHETHAKTRFSCGKR